MTAPPGRPTPVWTPPATRRSGAGAGAGALLAVLGLALLTVVALVVVGLSIGPGALPAATALALVPLAVVLLAIRWVDRWEPEPWASLAVGFGWGASVSVLVALLLNTGAAVVFAAAGAGEVDVLVASAVVVAPVVEETVKGLGVLLVVLVWRRTVDGPVDGLVHGATVAAGFAFVENVLYFGQALAVPAHAGPEVVTVFLLRAVLSPFAHVLFTGCTGLALGLASRSRHLGTWFVALPVGLVGAIALHALWNGSAVIASGQGFWGTYVTVQVPLFLATIGFVVWLRAQEARLLREHLTGYAVAGWFAPGEVAMLTSLRERRRARAWAAARGGSAARRAMRDFQRAATELAYQHARVHLQRDVGRARHAQAAQLARVGEARAAVLAATAAGRR